MHVINYFITYWKSLAWSLLLLLVTCLSTQFFTLPVSGLYLLGCVVAVAISTTLISFVTIQNFLHQNKPLNLPKLLNLKVNKQCEREDFNNAASIKQLTFDIDKYFIEEWFVYISKDPTFNSESRVILEEVLRKMVNVQLSLSNEAIIQGVLNLYLKHLKEFRRSLKRRDKYSGKISDLYRYSHMCSCSKKAKNFFIHQLTINLLNHFINWELGNSLPYQVLVSIISKQVMTYILNLLSNPEFINYYILRSCASENEKNELKLDDFNRVKISQNTTHYNDPDKSVSKANLSKVDATKNRAKEIKSELKKCNTFNVSLDLTSVPEGQDIPDSISLRESRQLENVTKVQTRGIPESGYEEPANLATIISKQGALQEQKASESRLLIPVVNSMSLGEIFNKILLADSVQIEDSLATTWINSIKKEQSKSEVPFIQTCDDGSPEHDECEEADEVDGVKSFYKSCAKTGTRVIRNTVKTIKRALPCNVEESDTYHGMQNWSFIKSNATNCDLCERMTKLLTERKVFYEALDSLDSLKQNDNLPQSNTQFDDEFDDFDVKLQVTKTLFDILCELLADNKETFLSKEPVIKSILLLFGNFIEENVVTHANYYLRYCCANAKIPSDGKIETLSMELEDFVTVVLSGIPDSVKCLLGENTVKDVVNLFVSSLQIEKINQDIMLQVFEILCMKLMEGSKQLSPMIPA
ncbi:uncharacterized protein LOC123014428 [Tribolium madens]|uniref:uncharacterized protein LOC123014428 n=1 Tax=Tribolium madens TaxID=41895 RepID=UPI001CF72031|nr:uncharacterized protein LOC123014428 [Tribolium madens]